MALLVRLLLFVSLVCFAHAFQETEDLPADSIQEEGNVEEKRVAFPAKAKAHRPTCPVVAKPLECPDEIDNGCSRDLDCNTYGEKCCRIGCDKACIPVKCEDDSKLNKSCSEWASKGYCARTHEYSDFMRRNCLKSCGLCGKPIKPAGCSDLKAYGCVGWSRFCKQYKGNIWFNFMKTNCKKTCKMC